MIKRLFAWLFPEPAVALPSLDELAFTAWRNQIASMELACGEILFCLGASEPGRTTYFNPFTTTDLDQAARQYFHSLFEQACHTHPRDAPRVLQALIAGGLFACGDLSAFEQVVAHAPATPVRLDHGAGHCNRAAFMPIIRLLPLPHHLRSPNIWFQGSDMLHELHTWYVINKQQLVWNTARHCYELVPQ